MLAVVSAVVAFDRWPGASVQSPAQTLLLSDKPAAIRVSAHSSAPSATRSSRPAVTRTAARRAAPHTNLTGGVLGERVGAGHQGAGVTPAPAGPAVPPVVPKTPEVPNAGDLIDPISNPGGTTSQIADGAQSVTDTAGRSLTQVSPDVGSTVTAAGQTAADAVRGVPLPAHVIPGY